MKKIILYKDYILKKSSFSVGDIHNNSLVIDTEDIKSNRILIKFIYFHDIKITKINRDNSKKYTCEECFYNGKYHRHILEVLDSDWVKEVKLENPNKKRCRNLRHYILFADKSIIEILSQGIKLKKKRGEYTFYFVLDQFSFTKMLSVPVRYFNKINKG